MTYSQLFARAALATALTAVSAGAVACGAPSGATAKPQTCPQQFAAWKNGAANAPGKRLENESAAVSKSNDDIPVMVSALKAMGADAAVLQGYPMPGCADPKGYWPQYLADIKAAGDNAGSASGFSGLLLAEAPLKNIKTLQAKLSAELKAAGIKDS